MYLPELQRARIGTKGAKEYAATGGQLPPLDVGKVQEFHGSLSKSWSGRSVAARAGLYTVSAPDRHGLRSSAGSCERRRSRVISGLPQTA